MQAYLCCKVPFPRFAKLENMGTVYPSQATRRLLAGTTCAFESGSSTGGLETSL